MPNLVKKSSMYLYFTPCNIKHKHKLPLAAITYAKSSPLFAHIPFVLLLKEAFQKRMMFLCELQLLFFMSL